MARLPDLLDLGPRPIPSGAGGPIAAYDGGKVGRAVASFGAELGQTASFIGAQIQQKEDQLARQNAALAEARYKNFVAEKTQDVDMRIRNGELLAQKAVDEQLAAIGLEGRKTFFSGIDQRYLPSLQVAAEGTDIGVRGKLREQLYSAQQFHQRAGLEDLIAEKMRNPGPDLEETAREVEYTRRAMGPSAGIDAATLQKQIADDRESLYFNDAKRRLQDGSEDLVSLDRLEHHLLAEDGEYRGLSTENKLNLRAQVLTQRSQLVAKDAQEVRSLLSQAEQAALNGVETPIDSSVIDRLPESERPRAQQEYARTQVAARAVRATAQTSPQEDLATLQAALPTQGGPDYQNRAQAFAALQQAVREKQTALKADPAGYSVAKSEVVRNAAERLTAATTPEEFAAYSAAYADAQIAEQKRLGVRAPRILTKGQVADINSKFYDQATGGVKAADAIYTEKAKWGQYWPQVQQELLTDAKLPNAVRVIATGVPRQSGEILARLSTEDLAALKKGVLGSNKVVAGYVSTAINEKFADFLEATSRQPDGVKTYEAFYDQAERVVYDALRRNVDLGDAVDTAYQVLLQDVSKRDRYSYSNDNTFLAPAEAGDIDVLEDAADRVLNAVNVAEIDRVRSGLPPELIGEQVGQYIKRDGYWVTDRGNRGVGLHVNGRVLLDREGQPIFRTWEELKTGTTAPSAQALNLGQIDRRATAPITAGQPQPSTSGPAELRTTQEAGLSPKEPLASDTSSKLNYPVRHGKRVVPIGQGTSLTALPLAERRKLPHEALELDEYAHAVELAKDIPAELLVTLKNAGERSESVPETRGKKRSVSSANARGVMQFIPSTAKHYGLDDPTDPVASLDAAGDFVADLLKMYKGNVRAVIAHYNGGTAAGRAVLNDKQPPVKETRDYLARVFRALSVATASSAVAGDR